MTAGANPGSGFDVTIRSVADALQKEGIVDVPLPVQNRPGGSGADFLATMVEQYKGADDQISVTSLAMMTNEFVGELKSGALNALGVLAEKRLPGLDVLTAREQGLDITLANWRGLYGPPDVPTPAVGYWQKALRQMVGSPTWRQIAQRSQFTTTFMVGDEFQAFLAKTQPAVKAALKAAGQ